MHDSVSKISSSLGVYHVFLCQLGEKEGVQGRRRKIYYSMMLKEQNFDLNLRASTQHFSNFLGGGTFDVLNVQF